ncbi:hypothetical protein F2Q70_00039709 [Brassica cretica]|uniref:DEAD/DEAH-box helicase domain-containing protein n=1 Tax=Brassica cretica TaxID=69181 RepID=A0A8S9K9G8_BRACR|nr:hypothetical protein F2Q70_00039709 [Brassica cretica]
MKPLDRYRNFPGIKSPHSKRKQICTLFPYTSPPSVSTLTSPPHDFRALITPQRLLRPDQSLCAIFLRPDLHRHHLLLTRRNWVFHPSSSWTNDFYQEREPGTQPPLCNSDSDPNQGEVDISVVLIDWKATLRVPPPDTRYQTGAFCISVLEKIDPNTNVIQTMILVPTRELALHTSQVCKELSKYLNIQVMVTTGGTSLRDDIKRSTSFCLQSSKLLSAEFQADYPLDTQQFTIFSGGQDWKATLRVPPPDTRYQTAMILVPMRELALQTSQVCKELSKYLNIQVMVTTGVCVLKDCTMLVMDEADKLLSAEFQAFVCRVPGRLSS